MLEVRDLSLPASSISETLSAVYDAALEPSLWSGALARLAHLFHAGFADKFARTHDRSSFCGIAHGLDADDYQQQLLGTWSKRNVWAQRRPVKLAGEILTTREILPREDLVRSEMYADYLHARGLHEGMRLAIWSGDEGIEDISLLRPWSIGAYTGAERDLAQSLMPHLRRAAEISRRLMRADIDSLADGAAIERIGQGVLLLSATGRIVHANPAAIAQLRTNDGIATAPAGLVAHTLSADRALQQAIHAACGHDRLARSSSVRLPRPSGRPALTLTLIPIDRSWPWMTPHRPKVLVLLADPAAEAKRPGWQRAFDLTAAETALAQALLTGEDLAAIAQRTRRSINTLRTHLARLLAKTGSTRQSDLIRVLLTAGSPTLD